MHDGVNVNPEELSRTATILSDIVGDVTAKTFAQPLDTEAFGHNGAHQAVNDFRAAIDLATQVLVQTTEGAGQALQETATAYLSQDETATDPIRRAAHDMPGGR